MPPQPDDDTTHGARLGTISYVLSLFDGSHKRLLPIQSGSPPSRNSDRVVKKSAVQAGESGFRSTDRARGWRLTLNRQNLLRFEDWFRVVEVHKYLPSPKRRNSSCSCGQLRNLKPNKGASLPPVSAVVELTFPHLAISSVNLTNRWMADG